MLSRTESGRRIRRARKATGLTMTEAAQRLGMRPQSLYDYESGRRVPGWDLLMKMIDRLQLPPLVLMPELGPAMKGEVEGTEPCQSNSNAPVERSTT